MKRFEQSFENPSRRYAIFPIIHGRIAASKRPIAERYEALGFAGVVGNVPYGPGFPNDENEWEQTARGFRSFIDKGMTTWIYDEKGYPSGTAGGAVIDENSDFIVEGLFCNKYWKAIYGPTHMRADYQDGKLYRAMLLPVGGGEAIDMTHCVDEKGVLRMDIPEGAFHLFTMTSRRLFDGTHTSASFSEPRNYISLNDKQATEAFIRHTHERYAHYLSDAFGSGVLAFFTDEPSFILCSRGVYPNLPWHRDFPRDFEAAYGYPIELAVVAVITKSGPECIKRRCDYWEFVSESAAENFFGTIQNWCRAHHIKSSGHLISEEDLFAHVPWYGSIYKVGKRFDWPGVDLLDCEPDKMMDKSRIPVGRLMASFADISGENETFTEFSDHFARSNNKQIGIDWIRASVNWHYAMGINNLTSYYGFDYFTDEQLVSLNRYAARLGYLIRQGRRDSKVAMLYPEAAIWSVYTPMSDKEPDTQRISGTFAKVSWALLNRQIDYDYVDEQLIWDATIQDGKLLYNARAYECLVIPDAHVLSTRTMEKITAMLDAGIGVVFVGELPKYARETGAEAGFTQMLERFKDNEKMSVVPIALDGSLVGLGKAQALPRPVTVAPKSLSTVIHFWSGTGGISDGEVISANILSHTRLLDDGTKIVFLCNMGVTTYEGVLRVADGGSMAVADPFTGTITPLETQTGDGFVTGKIKLRAYDGFAYIVNPA